LLTYYQKNITSNMVKVWEKHSLSIPPLKRLSGLRFGRLELKILTKLIMNLLDHAAVDWHCASGGSSRTKIKTRHVHHSVDVWYCSQERNRKRERK
jgi:hypothetical protein